MWLDERPRRDLPLPSWQRGHRVHGYWLDGALMGHVGLSPRGLPPVDYSWTIDAAKRRVEAAFRRLYSWRFPASCGY
jgi:hypothetical protein